MGFNSKYSKETGGRTAEEQGGVSDDSEEEAPGERGSGPTDPT